MSKYSKQINKGILLFGCIIMCLAAGGAYQPRSMYNVSVSEYLGISRSAFATTYSFAAFISVFVTAKLGSIKNKLGSYKRLVMLGYFLFVASLFVSSLGLGIWSYYLTNTMLLVAWHFSTTVPATGLINNWFDQNRGTLLGIVLAGTSIGGSIVSSALGNWLTDFGWQTSYRLTALLMVVAGVFVAITIKDIPPWEEGKTVENKAQKSKNKISDDNFFKERNFYLVGISIFFLCVSIQGTSLNVATILHDFGCEQDKIASATSLMLLISGMAKIVMGFVNDKFGIKVFRNLTISLCILGEACLLLGGKGISVYGYSVFFGLGYPVALLFLPLHASALFVGYDYANMMGYWTACISFGSILSAPLINLAYEIMGSYELIICFNISLLVIVILLFTFLQKPVASLGNKGVQ